MPLKSRQSLGSSGRSAHVGHEEKKSAHVNSQMHYKSGSSNGQMHSKSASSSGPMHSKSASLNGQMHHSKSGSLNGQMHAKAGAFNGQMHHPRSGSGSLNGQTNHARTGSMNGQVHSRSSSVNGPVHSKPLILNSASSSKSSLKPTDSRKHVGSNNGIGPGRPVAKTLPPKTPVVSLERKASVSGAKDPLPNGQKLPSSKMHSSDPRKHMEQRKGANEPNKPKIISKQSAAPSKPQMNKPLRQISSHNDHQPKKKPVKRSEDEIALDMIRKMFNTDRFEGRDFDDADDMEANFDDIMREERRSSKIAKKEDEEQLRLIEEEERQERMRKLAKKRKLSHH